MANEGGYSAGSIFLQVVPSFAGFEREARRVAKGMEGIFEESLDQAGERGANKARKHMEDALGGPISRRNAQTGGKKVADEFSGAFEKILQKRLGNAVAAIGKTGGEEVDKIRQRLEALKSAKIGIDIDAATAIAEVKELERAVDVVSRKNINIDARINAKAVHAELLAMNREIKGVDGKRITVKADFDDRASNKLAAFNKLIGRTGSSADDTANSFRTFNGVLLTSVTIGPALIPILAAIAGGLVALGPAAVAAASGLGVLAIGFSGLGDAISAMNDVQKNTAKDTQASSKRIANSAEAITDAQRRLKRAQEDAAESAEDAGRRTQRAQRDAAQANQDAARRVVDAQRQAAAGVESALDRQRRAEDSLADAQRDATEAQMDLREARAAAQKDLDDLAARQRKNAVDERQAVIDLFDATTEYNAIQADKGATNYEREQASINLENARIRLEDIRKEEKELADQRKKGVNDSQRVRTAEENVRTAVERQQDAQEAVRDAVKDTNQARIDGAREVQEAVQDQQRTEAEGAEAISDALREQRRAAEDSAEAISDAQLALVRAQKDYANALFETNEVGSASALKLKDAMDALGPAGQKFARFIFGLKDEFYAIRNAVQAGLFPGLQEGIQILIDTYFPDFVEFMGEMGKVFGDIAKATAQMLTNDTWKEFFSVFRQVSPELIRNYSVVFLNLATVMAQLMTLSAPFAVQFSEALADITGEMVKFLASEEGQRMWMSFLDEVKRLGPAVLKFFVALAPAALALIQALMPLGELLLKGLTSILLWIAAMDPKVLQGIVFTVLTLVAAFQLAAGVIAGVAAIFTPFGAVIGGVVVAIVALVGILVYLYTTSDTAKKIINAVFKSIGEFALWYIQNVAIPAVRAMGVAFRAVVDGIQWAWVTILKPAWDAISAAAVWLWREILQPVFTELGKLVSKVFTNVKWAWENILWPVLKVLGKIVWELWQLTVRVAFEAISASFRTMSDAMSWVWRKAIYPVISALANALGIDLNGKTLKHGLVGAFRTAMGLIGTIWDGLKLLAKGPIDFVVRTVLNDGLINGFNFLAGKLGMDAVERIPWPPKGFASGGIDGPYGIRPGYTPGRDTHLIAVGGGEAILRPELTRALGRDWVYGANAAAKVGGVSAAKRYVGAFKDGGVVWSVSGYGVGTPFGKRGPMWSSGYHTGTDFPAPTGTPIKAAMAGRVSSAGWSSWGGNLMKILSAGVGEWLYAHQSGFAARTGDNVSAGQLIGYVGSTGNSTGPHLHLELRVNGQAVDPMRVLNGGSIGEKDDPSRIGKIIGGIKDMAGWVKDAVSKPMEWLKSKVDGPIGDMKDKFGDTWFTRNLAKLPEKFFGALVEKIKGIASFGPDDEVSNIPQGDLQRMVQSMAASKYGWTGAQWNALNWLVNKESSWNPNAQNPTSTAFGLFQFLDGTWSGYGKKTSDPAKQAQYGLEYIFDRYGSPAAAKAFHQSHNWYSDGGVVPGGGDTVGGVTDNGTMMYDNGGYLPPGLTTVVNLTGKPEPVFTAEQFEGMRGGGGGLTYAPTFNASDLTADDVMDDFRFEVRRLRRGS